MLRLTWDDFDQAVARLAEQVPAGTTALLPVPRGGLALALALSHRLGLPILSAMAPIRGVALVDEIVDTGRTLNRLRLTLWQPDMPMLAWMVREGVELGGLYGAGVVEAGRWVVFPWEQPDAAAIAAEQEAYRAARQ